MNRGDTANLNGDARVVIVLATFNGGRFLREQLHSIQEQTESHWQLLIRDDESTDNTRDIIAEFARRDPRIVVLEDTHGPLGAAANFGVLLQQAFERGADYVFCADQDDVWQPHKVAGEMQAMRLAESESEVATSLLVHSDLEVVDASLHTIHSSFMCHMGLRPEVKQPLKTLLVQNFVTGCTLLVNRHLLELAIPLPKGAALHDWWLALCAAASGKIVYLPQTLVKYRQHAGNQVGAVGPIQAVLRCCRNGRKSFRRQRNNFLCGVAQAQELLCRIVKQGRIANPSALHLLRCYTALFDEVHSGWRRVMESRRLGIRKQTMTKQIAFLLQLFLCDVPAKEGPSEIIARSEIKPAA